LNAWNALCIGKDSNKVMESLSESFGTEDNLFGTEEKSFTKENDKREDDVKLGMKENMCDKTIVTTYPDFIKCLRKHFPSELSEAIIDEESQLRERKVSEIIANERFINIYVYT
jgi:hypothetical protein